MAYNRIIGCIWIIAAAWVAWGMTSQEWSDRTEYRTRRWFFIGVEIVLALSWCGLFINDRMSFSSGTLAYVCTWAGGISIVLLLVVLPCFWDTLGHVALIGWLMAALSVLYFLLYATARG